jgi:allophanate hydrolase
MIDSLQRAPLQRAYRAGSLTPEDVVEEVYARIAARGDDGVWIHLRDRQPTLAAARDLIRRFPGPELPPLFGLPFAVKDNIDVAGIPTTAACPKFAYVPDRTAPVVQRVLAAGAILIGKTNLDQFATGLSGTRSPYGVVGNPYDPTVIAGGSSSGSAVAVAAGLVSFSLGTDTAGSGRVPAGLTGTVGVKPSRGLVSTRGIVPACRSLDCPSVFALSVADGAGVLAVLAGPDSEDPYSRDLPLPPAVPPRIGFEGMRVGVPEVRDVVSDFDGDVAAAALFEEALHRLDRLGARLVPVDLGPFLEVGALLYDGPWLAERSADLEPFVNEHPEALHPVVRAVLDGARRVSGADAYRGAHSLAQARRQLDPTWDRIDALMVPTTPTAPTIQRMLADPIRANAALGRFTNFVNLLDLAGISVPSEATQDGLPVGVTFLAPAGADGLLLQLASAWQEAAARPVDGAGHVLDGAGASQQVGKASGGGVDQDEVLLAVVGAHLRGEPLNPDLVRLGARLHAEIPTAREYRLYALAEEPGRPPRPGLVRVPAGGPGARHSVPTEVYRIPVGALGRLMAGVRAPLGIGTVRLADGSQVLGFLCEQAGLEGATDISEHGGWRAYRASLVAV